LDVLAKEGDHVWTYFAGVVDSEGRYSFKEAVASNPNTSVNTLNILAKDSSWKVRQAVAKNPNTPTSILKILAKDNDKNVREATVNHHNTKKGCLAALFSIFLIVW